jgi:uncharacterized protein involved in tolerance to divalent cations
MEAREVAVIALASIIISQELNCPNILSKIKSIFELKGEMKQNITIAIASIVVSQEMKFPNLLLTMKRFIGMR